MVKKLFVVLALFVSSSAFAQYNFGGTCTSVGLWTQNALSQTRNLIDTINQLKDNPKCKGIEGVVLDLQNVASTLQPPSNDLQKDAQRMESIPSEISALTSYLKSSPGTQSVVNNKLMSLLANKAIEGASLTARNMSMGVGALAVRTKRAATVGSVMMEKAFEALPNFDECLIGNPNQGLAILSAATKIAGAFVSTDEGRSTSTASAIAHLTNFLRNKKFTKAVAKLRSQELFVSMNCLLESINMSYCTTYDNRYLLDWGIRNLGPQISDAKTEGNVSNPLAGYYVLVRNAPVISDWLQRVQNGVTPKLKTDALYQNDIRESVNGNVNDSATIQAMYSEAKRNLRRLNTTAEKQSYIFKILGDITDRLTMGQNIARGNSINFFVQGIPANMIPFALIGRREIPAEVFGLDQDGKRVTKIDWTDYMLNQGKYISEFSDPDKLAENVELNLNRIIDEARRRASDYLRSFLIVDRQNLVAEAIAPNGGQNLNVYQSLIATHNYLSVLLTRVDKLNGDKAMTLMIRDTMKKIKMVVDAFNKIRGMYNNKGLSPDEVTKAYDEVIEAAYTNFNILLQRDSFITTRLSTLVNFDYSLQIRSGVDLSEYGKQLMFALDKRLIESIVGVHGTEPSTAKIDLDRALTINKTNIEVYEQFFRDTLYPIILEMKLRSEGRGNEISNETMKKLRKDSLIQTFKDNPISSLWAASTFHIFGDSMLLLNRYLHHNDLYQGLFKWGVKSSDTEFGSYKQMRAVLCAQTLSFEDREFFRDVCAGAVIESPYAANPAFAANQDLNLKYDDYMVPDKSRRPTNQKSICAFRDYTRHNLVQWLTLDMQKNQQNASQDVILQEE